MNYFPWFVKEGVSITVIDPTNLKSWKNPAGGDHNSINGAVSRVYSYETDTPETRQDVINFLETVVPDGHYVAFWTLQNNLSANYFPEDWAADSIQTGKNIYNVLEAQGATMVRQLESKGPLPYALVYRKNGGLIQESIAADIEGTITFNWSLTRAVTEGSLMSTAIGPARTWGELQASISELTGPADSTDINIYGINPSTKDTVMLFENVNTPFDLGSINAQQYPYLQLEYYVTDDTDRTPAQLDHWRVYYTGIPEATINASNFFQVYKDSIQQGDQFSFEVAIENVSQHDMDSLLVKYTLTDERNNEITHYDRLEPLKKDAVIRSFFEVNTKNLSDQQRLTLEINPNEDQAELFHFNNFIIKDFFVERDQRNPVLDVTFDGLYIMNGDIVSSTPLIAEFLIGIFDENFKQGSISQFEERIFILQRNGNQRSTRYNIAIKNSASEFILTAASSISFRPR